MPHEDQVKDQVRLANDIVEVISQVVPLKRTGRNLKACCPFHQEKTPSFMVHPEKQIFRCFGCGASGDVFSFLMKYENLTFPEALRLLAERAHIPLPAYSAARQEKTGETEQLVEVYREAGQYYHQNFLHPVRGRAAREYFFKRGYDESVALEFRIGWAEEAWQGLFEALSKKGFPDTLLLRSGLIHRSPNGRLYDAFRGRLLFPIHTLQGKLVAFGGRILGDAKEGPKYLNSPETPIFHKRRELFGLYLAKKHIVDDRRQILVTEGYFDFLRLYHQGFRNAVATLGTSLTDDHVTILRRFVDEAIVIYDGDKAGEAASLRGLEVFLEGELSVKLVRLPSGYDPDDFLLQEGPEAFRRLLDQAKDFFDYKLELLLEKHNRWDTAGLLRISKELLETLAKVRSPVLTDRYLARLGSALGVEPASLRQELQKIRQRQERRAAPFAESPSSQGPSGGEGTREEILLLGLLMDDREIRQEKVDQVRPEDFESEKLRRLFSQIRESHTQGIQRSWPQWLDLISDSALRERVMEALDFDWPAEERRKAFGDAFSQIRKRQRQKKMEELRRRILESERAGDQDRLLAYTQEYQALLRLKDI